MRHEHETIVSALLPNQEALKMTLDSLAAADVKRQEIDIILNQKDLEEKDFSEVSGITFRDEALHDGKWGAGFGAALGGALGVTAMLMGNDMGLITGSIHTLIIVACGTVLGAWLGAGFAEEQYKTVDEALRKGKIFLRMHVHGFSRARQIKELLQRSNIAEMVHSY
jgi:hypothetical protein